MFVVLVVGVGGIWLCVVMSFGCSLSVLVVGLSSLLCGLSMMVMLNVIWNRFFVEVVLRIVVRVCWYCLVLL